MCGISLVVIRKQIPDFVQNSSKICTQDERLNTLIRCERKPNSHQPERSTSYLRSWNKKVFEIVLLENSPTKSNIFCYRTYLPITCSTQKICDSFVSHRRKSGLLCISQCRNKFEFEFFTEFYNKVINQSKELHRWACRMEGEGIEPNTYSWSSCYMGRKSRQYTLFQQSVQSRLSVYTDWISCMYLVQYPRLPFCGFIYLQLQMHI